MAIKKDCNNCAYHIQELPIGNRCMDCLADPKLPHWEPDLKPYLSAIDERHPEEVEYTFPNHPINPYQSRKESFVEALLNTASGFILSYLTWVLIAAPLFNIPVSHVETFGITCVFTVVSILRSYVWRRLFNNKFWRR